MSRSFFAVFLTFFVFFTTANAQKAEVTVSLNEAFFDALLDSIYQNFDPPEFSLASNSAGGHTDYQNQPKSSALAFADSSTAIKNPYCSESIKILREMNNVRTAVHFRDGKISVPLAFSGGYAPPFVGCVDFSGWADATIDLEFDKDAQKLVALVHVNSVNLNGTGGIGGSLIARLLQGSIDKKINPIEVLTLDKLSFVFPVGKSGNLKMNAKSVRTEVGTGLVNVIVSYQFVKP